MSPELLAGIGADAGYRVLTWGGCTIVFGAMPMSHASALMGIEPKGSVLSAQLARLASATFAWGPKAKVGELIAFLGDRHLKAAPPSMTPLERWLKVGERGASAESIVAHLRPEVPGLGKGNHPHDPDDLRRCMLLLEAVPGLAPEFHAYMSTASKVWAALIGKWPAITAQLHAEAGAIDWRTGEFKAPLTYALMRKAIEGAY